MIVLFFIVTVHRKLSHLYDDSLLDFRFHVTISDVNTSSSLKVFFISRPLINSCIFAAVLSVTARKTLYEPKETKTVKLKVNVVGTPSHVTWYKNKRPITITNRYSGGNVAAPDLTITNVELSDGGEYVCEITNGKDTARTSMIQLSPICECSFLSLNFHRFN